MNTQSKHTTIRNLTGVTALTFGLTLLVSFAGAQEVAGGAATREDRVYKGAMREMPGLKEAGITTVKGDENWDDMLGFGKESTMAEMMTLMMVGGSGMEHMKMAAMKPGMKMDKSSMPRMAMELQGLPVTATLAQNPPAVGENTVDVFVTDANGKPVTGLKLMATVAMTSMDMGTERPKSVEGKDGHYSVPVKFSMKGPWRVVLMNDGKADRNHAVQATLDFNVDGKTKWQQPKPMGGMKMAMTGTPSGDWTVTVNTDPKTLAVGKNMLDVTILDAAGKPVTKAKVMGAVEMTSMDMGVTKPKAQEGKDGHYTVPVEFSMKGPWRVTLTVTPPRQKPFTKVLDFNVPM